MYYDNLWQKLVNSISVTVFIIFISFIVINVVFSIATSLNNGLGVETQDLLNVSSD